MVYSDVANSNSGRFEILVKQSPLDDPQVCSDDNKNLTCIHVFQQLIDDLSVSLEQICQLVSYSLL